MWEPWRAEIVELHDFFQGWLSGSLPASETVFARFADTMDANFAIITPGGELVERAVLLRSLRSAHASRPGLRIWIERPHVRMNAGPLTLATYEEWQAMHGETTARISSVLFAEQHAAPNGLRWLHVHESWMPR
jgi:hypothetical protein